MNARKIFFVVSLSILLSGIAIPGYLGTAGYAQTTVSGVALQRGYRAGYSDGYMAGYRDIIDSMSKDLSRHTEYIKADRAYNSDYGSLQDYRDGYQQGFEAGYDTGFEKRSFESTLPADLTRRTSQNSNGSPELMAANKPADESQPVENNAGETVSGTTDSPMTASISVAIRQPRDRHSPGYRIDT